MYVARTVDTASAVDPKTRVNMRVHSSSRMSPDAPDKKKQQRTTVGIGEGAFLAWPVRDANGGG
jgi:hypothetical protein